MVALKRASTYYLFSFIILFIGISFMHWLLQNYIIPILLDTFGEPQNTFSKIAIAALSSFGFWAVFLVLIWIIWQIKYNEAAI